MGNWGEITIFSKKKTPFSKASFLGIHVSFWGCNAYDYDKSMEDPWDVGLVYYPT